jgi:hypothetical protein
LTDSDEHRQFVGYRFADIEKKLDKLTVEVQGLRGEVGKLRVDIEVVKIKGGLLGGLAGALGAVLSGLAYWMMKL